MTIKDRFAESEDRLRKLMTEALDGDAQAYETVLKALAVLLRGYFRKRLSRVPEELEDLVQETLLAIHNHRDTYDRGLPLTAWVHSIARYRLIDLYRRRAVRDEYLEPFDETAEVFATSDHEAAEARRDLLKLLDQLPDRQRLPILHTKLEGHSVAETAHLTGMSVPAVKAGVHRGLKALAALIRNKDES